MCSRSKGNDFGRVAASAAVCVCVCEYFVEVNINFEAAQDKNCTASGQTGRNIPETTSGDHFLKSHCAQCARVLAQITTRNGGGGSLRAHPAASARDAAGEDRGSRWGTGTATAAVMYVCSFY